MDNQKNMSRWTKIRPGVTVPVETLIKEKENTNRPSVARSAGTVGKWGITSFTSIRSSTYGLGSYNQYSPRQESANCSPQSGDFNQLSPGIISSPDPPKPRKFFKSRNAAPENLLKAFPPIIKSPELNLATTNHHNNRGGEDSLKIKINKLKTNNKKEKLEKEKKEKPIKAPKKKKEKPSTKINNEIDRTSLEEDDQNDREETTPVKTVPKLRIVDNSNKRTSSRTRNKIVNYNEDDDDTKYSIPERLLQEVEIINKPPSPPPTEQAKPEPLVVEKPDVINEIPPVIEKETPPPSATAATKSPTKDIPPSPIQKFVNNEHPPIVLRISKGTSRLISTDSEDVTFSPTHQNQNISNVSTAGSLSAAELLSVLTDTPETLAPEPSPIVSSIEVNDSKPESIKIKIKKKCVLENRVKSEKHKNKSHHHHHHHHKKKESIPKLILEIPKVQDINIPDEVIPEPNPIIIPEIKVAEQLNQPVKTPTKTPEVKGRTTRSSRRQQHLEPEPEKNEIISEENISQDIISVQTPQIESCPSPLPGTENYDLYRTLASSDEKEFDSQSSVLGSISSKETAFISGVPEDSRVIHSRGSSDLVTSDIDTSQSSVLVAPPSEINGPLDTVFESETEEKEEKEKEIEEKEVEEYNQIEVDKEIVLEEKEEETIAETPENIEKELNNCISLPPIVSNKRVTRRTMKSPSIEIVKSPIVLKTSGRITRNNNNIGTITEKEPIKQTTRVIRSYARKRKNPQKVEDEPLSNITPLTSPSAILTSPSSQNTNISNICNFDQNSIPNTNSNSSNNNWSVVTNKLSEIDQNDTTEYKIKNKFKKSFYEQDVHSDNSSQEKDTHNLNKIDDNFENNDHILNNKGNRVIEESDKPSVKLVITKKKGTFFKSRALVAAQDGNKKRHIYKHKWDDDTKEKTISNENVKNSTPFDDSFDDFDGETSSATRITRQRSSATGDETEVENLKCDTKVKTIVTVRNVKKAHQIQEIGEYQEMDDDVEYLLDALQIHNPISTRCLSAIQLAQKCMAPAFRMHVRAHGTVTKFFNALQDATKDQSLGLCTATVMFVLSQDNLNMDLDRHSLELMLNLLESDVSHKNVLDDCGSNTQPIQKHLQKVRELCEEIKSQGKAVHLNLDNITVGTMAMETLLSLTSKRAGEWFKEELRELGGLEHIIKSICECCRQISDYVVDWTNTLLEKLRKIERCLRVLENVTQLNEENQNYILSYNNGNAIHTLVKLYKLCDSEIVLYPTNQSTPKDNPGVVIREALVPTLKVLINLTHPFNEKAIGSVVIGDIAGIFDTSLHVILEAHNYIPEQCVFELSILVLLFLINLTTHTTANRKLIMEANAPTDFGNKFVKIPAIKALVQYFYSCDQMAKQVEQKTDDILENPIKPEIKAQTQEEYQETITKLLVQKAGHHMEHSMVASYVGILIGNLIVDSEANENKIRTYFPNGSFEDMISVLDKYYTFMNLTANSEAVLLAHIKSTKKLIEDLRQRDIEHSKNK